MSPHDDSSPKSATTTRSHWLAAIPALFALALLAGGCGGRTPLRLPLDASYPDAPPVGIDTVIGVDRVTPTDRVTPPDRINPPDVENVVQVICPAPVRGRQTDTVTLHGTATTTLMRPLFVQWSIERAPMGSTAQPETPDAPSTRFTFDTGGEWVFRFTAWDDQMHSSSCTVRAEADPAIDLLCPNDASGYLGATLPLVATAASRFARPITVAWTIESAPPTSMTRLVPPDRLASSILLDALGDWRLRLVATDSAGLTATCVTNVHADPDVIVECPPDSRSRPFATTRLAGNAASRLGLPLTYRWEIVERPITSTASLATPDRQATDFTFDVAGNWTYRFTATNSRGDFAYCTTRARSASEEAIRVEIVWNIDRSCRSCNPQGGGIDIDLHMTDFARSGGHWAFNAPDDSDCYYANCRCGSPGMPCEMETLDWPPSGRANNPQLDIDHISDLPGPENINVFRAEAGRRFDVGVHYFSGSEPTPVVARVYCGGAVVFESEPVVLNGGGAGNPLWLVGSINTTDGGCEFVRCGAPGMLADCIRPESDW